MIIDFNYISKNPIYLLPNIITGVKIHHIYEFYSYSRGGCTRGGRNLGATLEFCLPQIFIEGSSKGCTLGRRKIIPHGRAETQERKVSKENIKHMSKSAQITTI